MAVKKTTKTPAAAAHSAPSTPPDPGAAPSAGPAANGAAAAVWAALTASPGATTAAIAVAAGVSKSAAAKALAALETSGKATRAPGERAGRTQPPATWRPAPDAAAPANSGDGNVLSSGEPGAEPAGNSDTGAAAATGKTIPAETTSSSPADDSALDDGGGATDGNGEELRGEPGGPQPAAGSADGEATAASDGDGRATGAEPGDGGAPAPAVPEAATGLAEMAASAAKRAAEALAAADIAAALTELDAAYSDAAEARRLVKAAARGRKPRTGAGMRPGQLRDRVKEHLDANIGASLTPYEIGRVLGNSAGAVANALDRLVELGHAQLASEKPRRYVTTAAS